MAYSQQDSTRFDKHNYDIIISRHMSANPNLKRLRIATPIAASTTRRESLIGTGGEGYTGFHQRLSIRDAVPTQPPGSRVEYSGKRQSAPDCTTVSCSLALGISMHCIGQQRSTNQHVKHLLSSIQLLHCLCHYKPTQMSSNHHNILLDAVVLSDNW